MENTLSKLYDSLNAQPKARWLNRLVRCVVLRIHWWTYYPEVYRSTMHVQGVQRYCKLCGGQERWAELGRKWKSTK